MTVQKSFSIFVLIVVASIVGILFCSIDKIYVRDVKERRSGVTVVRCRACGA